MSAEGSEIPVKVDAGRLASQKNLFTSGLGPSCAFDYLHLSIFSFFKKTEPKPQRRLCKGKMGCKWSAGLLYRNFLHFYLVFARKSSLSVLLWMGGATRSPGLRWQGFCINSYWGSVPFYSKQSKHKKQDWLCGKGGQPSGLSILFHTGMQIQPQASSSCSPTFILRLTNGASWGGNVKGKAGGKGVSSFPPGRLMLYCLVSRGG